MDFTTALNYSFAPFSLGPAASGAITWANGWIVGAIVLSLLFASLAGIAYAALRAGTSNRAHPTPTGRIVWLESRLRVRVVDHPSIVNREILRNRRFVRQSLRLVRAARHPN